MFFPGDVPGIFFERCSAEIAWRSPAPRWKGFACAQKDFAEQKTERSGPWKCGFLDFFLLAEEFAAERNLSALFFDFNLFDV